jgi:alpha-beta hydrolase superfamily lysophospholipase
VTETEVQTEANVRAGAAARARAEAQAHWRAMPPQRLLDCGMLFGDILSLETATADGVPWDQAAEALGEAHAARAEEQLVRGHRVSATQSLRAASAAFQFAQMPLADGDRKRGLYRRIADTLRAIPDARFDRIEVPFAGRTMTGWTMQPDGTPRGAVVVFGGQSGWGASYLRVADALASRGIATVLAEGPGQGETRLFGGVYLDVDVAGAFSRFVDVAVTLSGTGGVGICGNSLGGLFAALTAARDDRIRACCVNGGFAAPRLLAFRAFREQAAAMLGEDRPEAIQANFDRLAFDPGRDRIAAELLVVHGGADPLVALEDQQPFLDGARPGHSRLMIWENGDHTIYNRGDERNAAVSDWFADHLAA